MGSLIRTVRNVFSFETVFVLFLFAGPIKSHPWLEDIPFDPTVAVFAGSVFLGGLLILTNRQRISVAAAYVALPGFLFIGWCLLSGVWAPDIPYATRKMLIVGGVLSWCLLAGAVFIGTRRNRVERFAVALAVLGIAMGAGTVRTVAQYQAGLFTVGGAAYLAVARIVGLALIALFFFCFVRRAVPLHGRIAAALGIALLTATMLILGARGPVLAAILALGAFIFFGRQRQSELGVPRGVLRGISTAVVIIGLAAALTISMSPEPKRIRLVSRFEALAQALGTGGVLQERQANMKKAIEIWRANPWKGEGLGSFPLEAGLGMERAYPHNIVLESAAELGIFGVALLLVTMVVPVLGFSFGQKQQDPVSVLLLAFFIYAVANSWISGDLSDNRLVFVTAGALATWCFQTSSFQPRRRADIASSFRYQSHQ